MNRLSKNESRSHRLLWYSGLPVLVGFTFLLLYEYFHSRFKDNIGARSGPTEMLSKNKS